MFPQEKALTKVIFEDFPVRPYFHCEGKSLFSQLISLQICEREVWFTCKTTVYRYRLSLLCDHNPKTFIKTWSLTCQFDFADYPRDHFLHNTANKKVLGKMKDETHGVPIEEFIGLRPKMYSLLNMEKDKPVEKKVAEGIAKHITKLLIVPTYMLLTT